MAKTSKILQSQKGPQKSRESAQYVAPFLMAPLLLEKYQGTDLTEGVGNPFFTRSSPTAAA